MRNDYYVYALFRPTGEPFYIGLGRADRIDHHFHRRSKGRSYREALIRKIVAEIGELPRRKLIDGLTAKEAGELERWFIAKLGRHPDGPLVNILPGGEGPHNLPEDVRAARAAKISATKLAQWDAKGRKPPRPKADPAQTKLKRRNAALAALADPDKRKRIIEARIAALRTEESKLRRSEAAKRRWQGLPPDERKARIDQLKTAQQKTLSSTNEKRREAMRQMLADPERGEKWRQARREAAAKQWSRYREGKAAC